MPGTRLLSSKRGNAFTVDLSAYENDILEQAQRKPYAIFRQLDLGAGGYALAPARDAKSAIAEVMRRKHAR